MYLVVRLTFSYFSLNLASNEHLNLTFQRRRYGRAPEH